MLPDRRYRKSPLIEVLADFCFDEGEIQDWDPKRLAQFSGKILAGALNIKWDAIAHMLVARAIARGGNTPHKLLGVFLDYLIEQPGKRIASINIQLR